MNPIKERLVQLLLITDKEVLHLEGVTQRLLNILPDNEEQLKEQLNDPQLIDTLESFSAKFSRTQDTIADKLKILTVQKNYFSLPMFRTG